MINITVKTLDSQNHQFSVEESLTVEQFKNHIAENVNVPAARQRIIYCGRVLQDASKLSDYDMDGKVVHLVQRAPPTNNQNARSLTPPPDLNRARAGFRGMEGGSAIYMGMGSMPVGPPGLMEGLPAPRAIHTLSSSRINVAKRMLRNAENVIRQLENPGGSSSDTTAQPEEPVEEEMTPVIEARVIVPSTGNQAIDGDAIMNAVHNTIFPAVNNIEVATSAFVSNSFPSTSSETGDTSTPQPAESTPQSAPSVNVNGGARQQEAPPRENRRRECHPSEMAALLTHLNQLQFRFTPFLARYQEFLQNDPEVAESDREETSQMLNRVSQVLHLLGHAYHSLSDIIVSLEQRRPRLLLCRPILIPPPNRLIQAGIPIQVEAQINLSAERPAATTPSTITSNVTSSTTAATSSSDSGATPDSSTGSDATTAAQSTRRATIPLAALQPHVQQGFVGMPFPTGTMRVITTPVEIRMEQQPSAADRRPPNNNNNTTTAPATAAPGSVSSTTREGAQRPAPPVDSSQPGEQRQGQAPPGGNMEFFMEVTPDALRNGNLIQSLMQIVSSQLGDTLNLANNQRPENATNQGGGAQAPGQPSQARSTQTNPTTATHTRSTPRPHVHMTQQRVQGGFDPFLPCHSHHIDVDPRPTRVSNSVPRVVPSDPPRNSEGNSGSGQQQNPEAATDTPRMPNFGPFSRLFESMASEGNARTASHQSGNVQEAPPTSGTPNGQSAGNRLADPLQAINLIFGPPSLPPPLMGDENPIASFRDRWTQFAAFDTIVQTLFTEPRGESLIVDFLLSVLRNIRLSDFMVIQHGDLTPLYEQIDTIRGFFLTEVCQNDTSDAGIDRATERIVSDFRSVINVLAPIPTREDVNLLRSIENRFRQGAAEIIRLAVNEEVAGEGNSGSQRAEALLSTMWRIGRELLALAVFCSANGATALEELMDRVMFSNPLNTSSESMFPRATIRVGLATLFQNLNVPPSDIQQYIVRNVPREASPPAVPPSESNDTTDQRDNAEGMDVDDVLSPPTEGAAAAAVPIPLPAPPAIVLEDTSEPLPNVIYGSEPWHAHTPEEWVPIITRDIQKQKKQPGQPPFSDAYLSGMPSKRRKLIAKGKPQGSLSDIVADSVRQAVTSVGLQSAAPLEEVARAAGESLEIQTAFRSLLQSTVRSNLENNEDFTAERYPNTSRFFNNDPPAE